MKKLLIIAMHVVFWLLLFVLPFYSQHRASNTEVIGGLVYNMLLVVLFYTNAYVIIPFIWPKKKPVLYFLISLLFLLLFLACNKFLSGFLPVDPGITKIVSHTLTKFALIWGFSFSYRIILDNAKLEKERKEKETESLKTELLFLRSQVSPHFMFNVLNSIVALIRQKSDKLEPLVLELSNIMRYMLYESDQEKVNFATELEYLKSYIDIQLLRFGDKINVVFEFPAEIPDASIEPMMMIPLIENAFKHGAIINKPEILIHLSFADDQLRLSIKNKYIASTRTAENKNSGIGLSNLQRRLSLLYPKSHTLEISKDNNWYYVLLIVNMK